MKKRILSLVLSAVICCLANISAYAEQGDVIGHIYSTDIRAYINGTEVPSYNIGGKTAVIVEDITTACSYLDNLRTLVIYASTAFSYQLKEFDSIPEGAAVSGNIVGDIYETDIEAYIYGMKIPSYNIGGKTAVAIEDLAGFKEYNDYGARYFYDDETRTITLEAICKNFNTERELREHLANVNYSMSADGTQINAQFYTDECGIGGSDSYSEELQAMIDSGKQLFLPVMTTVGGEEKQIGWFLSYKEKGYNYLGIEVDGELMTVGSYYSEDGNYKEIYELNDSFEYFTVLDGNAVDEAGAEQAVAVPSPRRKTIQEYLLSQANRVVDRIDTDDYSFLYTGWFGGPHGGNYERLLRVDNDGNMINYAQNFKSVSIWGQMEFDNVTIDKENEKVYFRYDKDYVIDLKTGEMSEK